MQNRDEFLRSLALLPQRQDEMTERLADWVRINSYSRHAAGLETMAETLWEVFSSLPAQGEKVSLGPVPEFTSRGEKVELKTAHALRWRCRPEAPFRVVLNGHFDTVYPPDHPFQKPVIHEGVMNGPGAADMKGGLLILYYALAHFEEHTGEQSHLGWDVLLVPDEEIGSHASNPLYSEAAKTAHAALVFEACLPDGSLARARRGSGTFNAVVTGRGAHVGRSFDEGRNAIAALARLVTGIHDLNGKVPGAVFNVGRIDGGGALNVVAEQAAAQFNFRVNDPGDIAAIEQRVEAIRQEVEATCECSVRWQGGFTRPPKPCTPPIEAIFSQLQCLGKELNQPLAWKDTGGCSDGNNLAAAGLPNIDTLGVVGSGIHSTQEVAELASLPQRAALTALLLYDWAAGRVPQILLDTTGA